MEDYLTFSLPHLLNTRYIILEIAAVPILLMIIMFILWKRNPKVGFARAATAFLMIGMALIPVAYFGVPVYNRVLLQNTVADDYGVKVTGMTNDSELVVMMKGKPYPCSINSKDQKSYYVLCEIKEGTVLLNDLAKNI